MEKIKRETSAEAEKRRERLEANKICKECGRNMASPYESLKEGIEYLCSACKKKYIIPRKD